MYWLEEQKDVKRIMLIDRCIIPNYYYNLGYRQIKNRRLFKKILNINITPEVYYKCVKYKKKKINIVIMSHEMGNTNPLLNKIHVELNPERINAHRNIDSFYKFYQTRQKNRAVLEIENIVLCSSRTKL